MVTWSNLKIIITIASALLFDLGISDICLVSSTHARFIWISFFEVGPIYHVRTKLPSFTVTYLTLNDKLKILPCPKRSTNVPLNPNRTNIVFGLYLFYPRSNPILIQYFVCLSQESIQDDDIDGFVVVFRIDDRSTFAHATDLLYELRKVRATQSAVILVANKCDLVRSREVSTEGEISQLLHETLRVVGS